jgi:thymidylate synthase
MQQYQDLLRTILDSGSWQENRTGVRTLSVPGAMMRFDLRQGFPAVTTKKLAFKTLIGELIGFLRASRNAAEFRALGCKVWDQNANENARWLANPYRAGEDDLGPVYGVQWREWPAYKVLRSTEVGRIDDAVRRGYHIVSGFLDNDGHTRILLYKAIDQLRQCLDTIVNDPTDRRILFHGWNPAQIEEMALPPCHVLYHFLPNPTTREISLCLYQRSADTFLGVPFNVASAAALLHLVGRLTGYTPAWLSHFMGDTHLYENHLQEANEQLTRKPYPLPFLAISDRVPDFANTGRYEPDWLEKVEPADFALVGYEHHPPLSAPMAV